MEFFSRLKTHTRRGAAFGGALAALLMVGLWPWSLPSPLVRGQIESSLVDLPHGTGIRKLGKAHFSALPWPTVTVEALEIQVPEGRLASLAARDLRLRVSPAGWLFGSPKISSGTVGDLDLTLRGEPPPLMDLANRLGEVLLGGPPGQLRSIEITRAAVFGGDQPILTDIKAKLSRLGTGDQSGKGQFTHGGDTYRFRAALGSGSRIERRALTWSIAGGGVEATFDGALLQGGASDATGRFRVTVDPETLAEGLVTTFGSLARHAGRIGLEGDARLSYPGLLLRNADLAIGGERFQGSFDLLLREGRPSVAAILHTKVLDATAAVGAISGLSPDEFQSLANRRLGQGLMGGGRFDLRLSADAIRFGDLIVEKTAVSAALSDERTEFAVNEAHLAGGTLKLRLNTVATAAVPEWRVQASMDRVNLGVLPRGMSLSQVRGLLSGSLALDARIPADTHPLLSANGRFSATIRDGEWPGIDLARSGPQALAPNARTRFQNLQLAGRIERGVATFADSQVVTGNRSHAILGSLHLPLGQFDLMLRQGETETGPTLRLRGPWRSPTPSTGG